MYFKISTLLFSATGTTKKAVLELADRLKNNYDLKSDINIIDFTSPTARKKEVKFDSNDIVIVGVPVYAGRVPNVLLKFLNSIKGNRAVAIALVVYGNRHYDDALLELKEILVSDEFRVAAAGAFIGEHSFSKTLAEGRPDNTDILKIHEFADSIYKKLSENDTSDNLTVKGNKPYRPYYKPKNDSGDSVDIRKVVPKTNVSVCNDCKLCAEICPMASIDYEDTSKLNGICIKCCACIKSCPTEAKYFDDEDYLRHKRELEAECSTRREPEIFL